MIESPTVTAIVSAYKSERFLRGCLDDLEAQTIRDRLEIIIVDSNSPEREGDIAQEYASRFDNVRYVRTPERETVYGAWNRAIESSTGEYITNANTDDRHRADAFEVMSAVLDANPDVGLVYAGYLTTAVENETFDRNTATDTLIPLPYERRALMQGYCFPGPQPMWRRSLHERFGLFDATYSSAGDLEFWMRISAGTRFMLIPQVLGLYLQSAGSVEHQDVTRSREEAMRAIYQHHDA